ncbi:hypothetical protein Tco_0199741 [Tanacetum coccineum]
MRGVIQCVSVLGELPQRAESDSSRHAVCELVKEISQNNRQIRNLSFVSRHTVVDQTYDANVVYDTSVNPSNKSPTLPASAPLDRITSVVSYIFLSSMLSEIEDIISLRE